MIHANDFYYVGDISIYYVETGDKHFCREESSSMDN